MEEVKPGSPDSTNKYFEQPQAPAPHDSSKLSVSIRSKQSSKHLETDDS